MAGQKILIIEDNPMNMELATDLLEASGYVVIQAGVPGEGIELSRVESPDLILMDISLPGMDGLEATGILKQDSGTRDIPVIAMTAHAMKGDKEKALAAGCAGYITKPIDTREFPKAVARFIEAAGSPQKEACIIMNQPKHVLIVDDMDVNLDLLEARLKGSGYEVTSAGNGVEALERLKRGSIDIIISDILMPGMDGFQLCRECKTDETLRKIPFVFYTATYTDKKDEEFALSLGAARFIVKPMDSKRFIEIIEGILKNNEKGLLLSPEIPVEKEETVYLKEYNERLIKKLESKVLDMEKANRALRESEEVYKESQQFTRGVIEANLDAWVTISAEGKITDVNQATELITGLSRKEIIGTDFSKYFTDTEAVRKGYQKVFRDGYVRDYPLEIKHRDGKIIPVLYNASVYKDAQGRTAGTFAAVRDITEQKLAEEEKKKLEAQFRQAQKMEAIGTLAGGVAHDFNNILTTIIGNANLALMEVGKDDTLREEIEEIKIAGERAVSLTRQLLAFSRKQVIKPEVLDLNEVINETEKMLKRMIGEDVEFQTVFEHELWKVYADSGQIDQVIMNLAVNARDSMPQGGKLTIETANVDLNENYFREHAIEGEKPGHYVMLVVSDTGSGIDKETREHIFEPFFTTKEMGKGTGLGLSTVYGITKQSNGFIWVYSEPGQGTTFKIYLPRVEEGAEQEEKERTPVDDLNGSETCLIVEDDDTVRDLARQILERYGYSVLEAETGEDALMVSEEHEGPIHLLLTDVVMPKMSGRELAKRLQSLRSEIKVIYMSGYTDDAIVHHGVLASGLNFIGKPFMPEGLARKVREVLDQGIED